jgi:hypothetical protein
MFSGYGASSKKVTDIKPNIGLVPRKFKNRSIKLLGAT